MEIILPKEQLLELLHQAHRSQQTFIAELNPAGRAEIGTLEHWSARDLIAHTTVWQGRFTQAWQAAARGETPAALEEVDRVNLQTFEANRKRAWDQVQFEAKHVFTSFIRQVSHCKEADLQSPIPFAWYNNYPLIKSLLVNSYTHPLHHLAGYFCERGDPARAVQIQLAVVHALRPFDIQLHLCGQALYELAGLQAAANGLQTAIETLRKAFAAQPDLAEDIRHNHDFASLVNEPGFQALFEQG